MITYYVICGLGHLGFTVCNQLLEEGYEVYHINICDEFENEEALEERKFLIGRNSNFHILTTDNEIASSDIEEHRFVFPVHDWRVFSKRQIVILEEKLRELIMKLDRLSETEYFLLLPKNYETSLIEIDVRDGESDGLFNLDSYFIKKTDKDSLLSEILDALSSFESIK